MYCDVTPCNVADINRNVDDPVRNSAASLLDDDVFILVDALLWIQYYWKFGTWHLNHYIIFNSQSCILVIIAVIVIWLTL